MGITPTLLSPRKLRPRRNFPVNKTGRTSETCGTTLRGVDSFEDATPGHVAGIIAGLSYRHRRVASQRADHFEMVPEAGVEPATKGL
jgi:hypothetical protein